MTYSGIVQKYKGGIGAFDWPEGVGPWGGQNYVTKFVLLAQFYSKSMLPSFIMSDTYDFIASIQD